jgi:hypothetical protein
MFLLIWVGSFCVHFLMIPLLLPVSRLTGRTDNPCCFITATALSLDGISSDAMADVLKQPVISLIGQALTHPPDIKALVVGGDAQGFCQHWAGRHFLRVRRVCDHAGPGLTVITEAVVLVFANILRQSPFDGVPMDIARTA